MIVSLLVGTGVVAVVAVRRMTARGGGPATEGHAVRRLFQYLLLYALLVVVATGLSGLLGGLLSAPLASADQSELARSVAFTVVGVPLFVLVALWSRRRLAVDPFEAASPAWALYITAASLTSLVVAMLALHDVLSWAAGLQVYSGRSLARLIVWGSVWGLHWWVQTRVVPADRYRVHHVVGSLIGLVTAATGLAGSWPAPCRRSWGSARTPSWPAATTACCAGRSRWLSGRRSGSSTGSGRWPVRSVTRCGWATSCWQASVVVSSRRSPPRAPSCTTSSSGSSATLAPKRPRVTADSPSAAAAASTASSCGGTTKPYWGLPAIATARSCDGSTSTSWPASACWRLPAA